jgi:hypothetical protein
VFLDPDSETIGTMADCGEPPPDTTAPGEVGQAIAGIAVQHSEIDADADHRTPAEEVGARIGRAFKNP